MDVGVMEEMGMGAREDFRWGVGQAEDMWSKRTQRREYGSPARSTTTR